MTDQLTGGDLDRIFRQKGFGNPAGPYWFIGLEEGGGGGVEELRVRARDIREIDDFGRVHALPSFYLDRTKHVTATWIIMSKIVRRLKGHEDWRDRDAALEYQAKHLGQAAGETFLAEIMPLPVPQKTAWPYPQLFPTREEYERQVKPMRVALLRELAEAHRPRIVVSYGKGLINWQDHQTVFPKAQFKPILDGHLLLGQHGGSTIVLTPFFHYWLMTPDLIDAMANELERVRA